MRGKALQGTSEKDTEFVTTCKHFKVTPCGQMELMVGERTKCMLQGLTIDRIKSAYRQDILVG